MNLPCYICYNIGFRDGNVILKELKGKVVSGYENADRNGNYVLELNDKKIKSNDSNFIAILQYCARNFTGKNIILQYIKEDTSTSTSQPIRVFASDEFPVFAKNSIKDVILPAWVKDLLPTEINQDNIDIRKTYEINDDEKKNEYLSRYFPRTFATAYCIVYDLLKNKEFHGRQNNKQKASILDLGCGVGGGATLGAITALVQHFRELKEIDILACDYTEKALNSLKEIIDKICEVNIFPKINIITQQVQLVPNNANGNCQYTFESFGNYLMGNNLSFDFAFCFKVINELIYGQNFLHLLGDSNPYSLVSEIICPRLKENGCFVLLDITMSPENNKQDENKYNRLLFNGTNCFLKNNNIYKSILPIPCSLQSGQKCRDENILPCFPQRRFFCASSCGNFSTRCDNVAFRVIVPSALADEILIPHTETTGNGYVITEQVDGKTLNCNYRNSDNLDSFSINIEKWTRR